jgi:DNA-binding GntR family transcriptional regulator
MTTVPLMPVNPRGTVLGDAVYNAIGEAILDGRLAPGQHLRDQELAGWLGVSRTPVREALQRLQRTGLVEVSPNRYTRVTQHEPELVEEIHEFVVLLLGNITRLAVQRADDATRAEIVSQIDDLLVASKADDRMGMLDRSTRLFTTLTEAAGNRAFARVMREAELTIRRNVAGWHPFPEWPETRSAGYEAFRDAVAAGDADAAERALRTQHGLT